MSVSTLVLLGLAVVWAIVLLPEVLKKVSGVRAGDSIHSFRSQLSSLERSIPGRRRDNVIDLRDHAGAPVQRAGAGPRPVSPGVRRRRQEVMGTLAAAAVLTLLCTVAFGGAFLLLHLLADALLVAYLVLLNQANQVSARSAASPLQRPMPVSGARIAPAAAERFVATADHGHGAVGRVRPMGPGPRRIAN